MHNPPGALVGSFDTPATGSDRGLLRGMNERIEAAYGQLPERWLVERWLVDGGYTCHADVEWAHAKTPAGIEMYCPPGGA